MTFSRDVSGNLSLIAALAMIPIFGAAAAAIDVSIAMVRKTEVQTAADAAVLSAASIAKTSSDDLKKEVKAVFKANLDPQLFATTIIEDIDVAADQHITLSVRTRVPLTIGKMLFGDDVQVAVLAQSVRADYRKLEIALVLDNTYSMSGKKLTDLKAASNRLLDAFQSAKTDVRVSLIPFSRYVNVGLSNRSKPWLAVDADYTKNICSTSKPVVSKTGCKMVPATGVNDGISFTYMKEACDNTVFGPPVTTCSNKTYAWSGCVGSRLNPLDVKDIQPTSKYPGLIDTGCGAPLMPLTNNFSAMRTAISKMTANNETYIPAGVLWGWNSLTPAEPLPDAEPKAPGVAKYIILMTDGANTLSPTKTNYATHTGTDGSKADSLLAAVCTNAKEDGITIVTVGVGISAAAADALEKCASSRSQTYSVDDSARLGDVFKQIAGQIFSPRLTK